MQHSDQASVRLFRSPLLESLTHVHPIVPLVLWAPVAAVLVWRSLLVHQLPVVPFLLAAAAGLLVWTFTEYGVHRFLFHFRARSRPGKWLVFLFHGVHHEDPQDKSRLVMPPAGAVLIMGLLWLLFGTVIPSPWIEPFGAFFVIGYLCYDYIHYATHHFQLESPIFRHLRRHHMLHHYSDRKGRYGVSSPLWDIVFGSTGNGPDPRRRP